MWPSDPQQCLSQIQTLWTVVGEAAGAGPPQAVSSAREQLLARYGKAIERYLRAALRDADAADDLYQEFALRFVRGDLSGADAERGRFRDYLKGVLFHLIGDYYRRQRKQPLSLPSELEPAASPAESAGGDEEFLASWRKELVTRAWSSLLEVEKRTRQPYHTVLQFRVARPDLNSDEMASQLSARLGKLVSAAWVRQTVHRARERLARALVDEVLQTLRRPSIEDLEQELIDLGLMEHCRPVLRKMHNKQTPE